GSVSNNIFTVTGMTINQAGRYTLQVNAPGLTGVSTNYFNVSAAPAGTLTRTGTGGSVYWNNPTKWSPGRTPVNGDSLVFPRLGSGAGTYSVDNVQLSSLSGISVTGSSYTITPSGVSGFSTGTISYTGSGNYLGLPNGSTLTGGLYDMGAS